MKNFLAVLAVLFLLFGCQNNNSEPDKNGSFFSDNKTTGIVNEGIDLIPTGFIPYYSPSANDIVDLIYSKLIRYDEKNELIGDLANDWHIFSPSSIEFKLRKNIFWHDGVSLSKDDFIKSFEIAKKLKLLDYDNLTVEFNDDTLIINSDKKIDINSFAKIFILPAHKLNDVNLQNSSLLYKPVGTGAFKFESSDNNFVHLKKFNKYFKKKIYISNYNFVIADNLQKLFELFEADKINFIKLTNYSQDITSYIDKINNKAFLSTNYQVLAVNPKSKNLHSSAIRNYFTELIKNKEDDLINDKIYKKYPVEALNNVEKPEYSPGRILLIVENDKYILKIAKRIKDIWEKQDVEVVLQKKSFSEVVYYINKGFKSDAVLFNWKNLNLQGLNIFYNLNFEDMKTDKAIKMLVNSGYLLPFSRKLNFVFYKENIKGIKVNHGLNHPEDWYFEK